MQSFCLCSSVQCNKILACLDLLNHHHHNQDTNLFYCQKETSSCFEVKFYSNPKSWLLSLHWYNFVLLKMLYVDCVIYYTIIPCVTFEIFSLAITFFRSIPVDVLCINSLFFMDLSNISWYVRITVRLATTHWRTFRLFPVFVCYKQRCYEQPYAECGMDANFIPLG